MDEKPLITTPPTHQAEEEVLGDSSHPIFPPPLSSVLNHNFLDITDQLSTFADELEVGELAHDDENFGLFEAMSSLEIMDPKMDSGVGAQDVLTLKEALETGDLPPDTSLSFPEILGIMDQLLCHEVLWYSGNSIIQTIQTCLYLHDVSLLKNELLSIFSLSLLKSCSAIRQLILRADVLEQEEDFILGTYGLDLLDDYPEASMLKRLNQADDVLQAKLRVLKTKNKTQTAPQPPSSADLPFFPDIKDEALCEAFLARLRFRRAFYNMNVQLDKATNRFEVIKKTIAYAQAQLPLIKSSACLAVAPPPVVFQPLLVRRFITPTAPRPIPPMTIDSAIQYFESLLNNTLKICNLTEPITLQGLLDDVIPRFYNPFPDIIARSRFRTVLVSGERKVLGRTPFSDVVKESFVSLSVPAHLLSNPLAQAFLERATRVVVNLVHILCHNKVRQWRKLAHLFEEWSIIQQEADQLDKQLVEPPPPEPEHQHEKESCAHGCSHSQQQESLSSHPFFCWTFHFTLYTMIYYLQLGFELDLYTSNEYASIFWYQDYVMGKYVQNQILLAQSRKQQQTAASKKKKVRGKKEEVPPSTPPSLTTTQLIESNHALTRGLCRLVLALQADKMLTEPEFPFGSAELRFYHRFLPFQRLYQPSLLYYTQFHATTNAKHTADQLYHAAADCLKIAQTTAERVVKSNPAPHVLAAAKSLSKVGATNLVATNLLRQISSTKDGSSSATRRHVSFDLSVDVHFPVVVLKS